MFAVYVLDGCYTNVLHIYIYIRTNVYLLEKRMKFNYGKSHCLWHIIGHTDGNKIIMIAHN